MTKERLYNVSKSLHLLKTHAENFWNMHTYRLAHFADSSPLGLDCRYVRATFEGYVVEQEAKKLRKILLEMRATIDTILGELDAD